MRFVNAPPVLSAEMALPPEAALYCGATVEMEEEIDCKMGGFDVSVAVTVAAPVAFKEMLKAKG